MVKILSYIMNSLFSFTGDWGLAILILTLGAKLLLLPVSLKGKKNMQRQLETNKEIEKIQKKYKNDEARMQKEMIEIYSKNRGNLLGSFIVFLNIPIITSLYRVVMNITAESGTILVPWIESIKFTDNYFILPIVYLIINMMPTLLGNVVFFKNLNYDKGNKLSIIISAVFSLLIIGKAPVSVGIYFIVSAVFSFLEDFLYRVYLKKAATV